MFLKIWCAHLAKLKGELSEILQWKHSESIKWLLQLRAQHPACVHPKVSPSKLLWHLMVENGPSWAPFLLPVSFTRHHPAIQLFLDAVVPKLKRSLSLTLRHYLPLTRDLTLPQDSHKPIIVYDQGGSVLLLVPESTMDFRCEATQCHPLLPRLSWSNERALAIKSLCFLTEAFALELQPTYADHHLISRSQQCHCCRSSRCSMIGNSSIIQTRSKLLSWMRDWILAEDQTTEA